MDDDAERVGQANQQEAVMGYESNKPGGKPESKAEKSTPNTYTIANLGKLAVKGAMKK